MKLLKMALIALVALALAGIAAFALLRPPAKFDARVAFVTDLIDKGARAGTWPGVMWAVIQDGEIAASGAGGFADLEAQRPMTPDTTMPIASISKVIVGLAGAQAIEDGALDPDRPITDYLSFSPAFPDGAPRSFAHLATHTSGLRDSDAGYDGAAYHIGATRHPVPLKGFLQSYLTEGGALYDAEANFTGQAPGTQYEYSNIGAGLAAQVIADATGEDFGAYSTRTIVQPLGLSGFWGPERESPGPQAAKLYTRDDSGALTPFEPYGLATWPDGQFNASAHDLARLLSAVIHEGSVSDGTGLSPEVIARLTTPLAEDIPGMEAPGDAVGLFWSRETLNLIVFSLRGEGHNGGDPGIATFMYRRPGTDDGFVAMMNTEPDSPWQMLQAIRLLHALSGFPAR